MSLISFNLILSICFSAHLRVARKDFVLMPAEQSICVHIQRKSRLNVQFLNVTANLRMQSTWDDTNLMLMASTRRNFHAEFVQRSSQKMFYSKSICKNMRCKSNWTSCSSLLLFELEIFINKNKNSDMFSCSHSISCFWYYYTGSRFIFWSQLNFFSESSRHDFIRIWHWIKYIYWLSTECRFIWTNRVYRWNTN